MAWTEIWLSSEDLTARQPSLLERSFFPLPGLEGDFIILLCTILLLDQHSPPSYTTPASWRLCLSTKTIIFFSWPLFIDFLLATSLLLNFDLSILNPFDAPFIIPGNLAFQFLSFSLKWSFPLHPLQNLKFIYVFDHSFPLFWYFLLHDIHLNHNHLFIIIQLISAITPFISSWDFMIHYCNFSLANILELCRIPTLVHFSPYLRMEKYNIAEGKKNQTSKASSTLLNHPTLKKIKHH